LGTQATAHQTLAISLILKGFVAVAKRLAKPRLV
jgi:hypothetical protein